MCAGTRVSQPPFRHDVIELVKANGTNENGATAARGQIGEKIPAASDAMPMQYRCAGPNSMLTRVRLPLVTVPTAVAHLHVKHLGKSGSRDAINL
jgi:hypothetical protein